MSAKYSSIGTAKRLSEDEKQLITQLHQQGQSNAQIAAAIGRDWHAVDRCVRILHGRPTKYQRTTKRPYHQITDAEALVIVERYQTESANDVGKSLGVSATAVRKCLAKMGVTLRDGASARALAAPKMPKATMTPDERRHQKQEYGICVHCHGLTLGMSSCEGCRERRRARVAANREAGKCVCGQQATDGSKCKKCRDAFRPMAAKHARKKRAQNRANGLCYQCGLREPAPLLRYCIECSRQRAALKRKLRLEVMDAYGGAVCACCGETLYEGLHMDHVNNDGAEQRKNGKHLNIYFRLRKLGFPKGFQVLCATCNFAKKYYGVCPHVFLRDKMLESLRAIPLTY